MALRLQPVVFYTSRAPRPGEVEGKDYHFRTAAQVEALRKDPRFVVLEVRGDLQALDQEELQTLLARGDAFFEGNPYAGRMLLEHPMLSAVPKTSAFLAPLSRDEILHLQSVPNLSLPDVVIDVMRRKLLRRTRRQKGELSLNDLTIIERRAASAYQELREAHRFRWVIPNHDGEDSENWDAFYHPLGDARRALLAFVAILKGETPVGAESWELDLLP